MADRDPILSVSAVALIAATAGCYTGPQAGRPGDRPEVIQAERERLLVAQCEDRNYRWVTQADGTRVQIGQALTDGARYVWRNGRCDVIGGLQVPPFPPPPKPNP